MDKLELDEKVNLLKGSVIRIQNKVYALEKKPIDRAGVSVLPGVPYN